jgi:prefoldin alpha subunit
MTSALSPPTVSNSGIPQAIFIDDVDAWILKHNTIEKTLDDLQEQLGKYKFMFEHFEQRKKALNEKLIEIRRSIEAIQRIEHSNSIEKEDLIEFEHADTLYTKAYVPPTGKVNLWLGAGMMVEYSTTEAINLLKEKKNSIEQNIESLEQDLVYLKEQITTTEVNIARVFNWNVKKRQSENKK